MVQQRPLNDNQAGSQSVSLLDGSQVRYTRTEKKSQVLAEAGTYLHVLQQEMEPARFEIERLVQIQREIEQRETYWQTSEELVYGAKLAWRNSTRCIGRLHWKSLIVRDMRYLRSAADIFAAIVEHLHIAYNNGKIRSVMTVLPPQLPDQPGFRIWNPQYICYAGYRQADGSVIGDPLMVDLTEQAFKYGWRGGPGTPFDVLPLLIQVPGQHPQLFELPPEAVVEVSIEHPEYPWFADLRLKWHALPVISNMRMEIGGVSYPAAPFNGWYMGTEIGARDLGDAQRYNMLPAIAAKMGLNLRSDRTLWKDRALVELNVAVLHSFVAAGVAMVDHHTASRQFVQHGALENKAGRCMYADWGWIVPPISGSITPVFHIPYEDVVLTPNFFYQTSPWLNHEVSRLNTCLL